MPVVYAFHPSCSLPEAIGPCHLPVWGERSPGHIIPAREGRIYRLRWSPAVSLRQGRSRGAGQIGRYLDTFHLRFLLCSLLPNGCLLLSTTSLSKALVI